MKLAIATLLLIVGFIDNELITLVVAAPLAVAGLALFFIKAGEGGAFN